MIKLRLTLTCLILASCLSNSKAENSFLSDSTGLPGDHFSLEAALDLFKNSESPEDFEKKLNSEENKVNNLDLNNDQETDYLRVIDKTEGAAHAIIIQAVINENESQDVAVIEIEKTAEDAASLQIVGDEDLYGKDVIAEPVEMEQVPAQKQGDKGPAPFDLIYKKVIVNIWFWRPVRFIYAPAYVVWVSPFGWHHYPGFWRPWRPYPLHIYYAACAPYRAPYHIVRVRRMALAHACYAPHRRTSVVVHSRNRQPNQNVNYGPRNRKAAVQNQQGNRRTGAASRPARKANVSPRQGRRK